MKTFLFIAMLSGLLPDSIAQNHSVMENMQQEKNAITQALENFYFKGIYTGDTGLLKAVYHPGTLLFGDVKGAAYAKTLAEYLDGVVHRQSPENSGKPFKGSIIAIDVINSIAMVKVRVKMYEFNYDEFLALHKLGGKWLIVNKMISDIGE